MLGGDSDQQLPAPNLFSIASPTFAHVHSAPSSDAHPVRCFWQDCDQSHATEEAAFAHLIRDHCHPGKQICLWRPHPGRPCCSQKLRNAGNFADHVVTHFTLALRPLKCERCSARLRNRQDAKRHEGKHKVMVGSGCELREGG
ncbi:hypothetical protein BDK51DRAFT_31293, partial [Blyttiomyces helicus]